MQGAAFADMKQKTTLRQRLLLIFGIAAICAGLGILGFFGGRKVFRMIKKQKLLSENVVLEIPALKIKAPVLEGTGNEILAKAVGHFPGTGAPGSGNYCLAGHSSTLYKEYFNRLKEAEQGTEIMLYDLERNCYTYQVTESFIIEPNEIGILLPSEDDRSTLVTCTDDGTQRLCVIGQRCDAQDPRNTD